MKLILASKSPRRRALLKTLGIAFRVMPSHIGESSRAKSPRIRVQELALRKARSVARKIKEGWVLGADTLVVCGGEILGQPGSARDAYRMLYKLSGTTHTVYTGLALVDASSGRSRKSVAKSRVRMKKLPLDVLLKLSQRHLDKAGAYAIQEKRDPIAKVVEGSYDNVVGLPRALVRQLLQRAS